MENALVSKLLRTKENTTALNILIVVAGAVSLSILAQVSIPLPFTPVPITGQTFGVSLMALLFGARRAMATVWLYLLAGAVGLPVFSLGRSGLFWGPTIGYLGGMLLASYVVGFLADRGWANTFTRGYLAASVGSAITFIFGLSVLSFFVPSNQLLAAGLYPFLLGDFLKNSLAAAIARAANSISSGSDC